jgi:glutamate-1-semialdehyde 2,1-aminomutase
MNRPRPESDRLFARAQELIPGGVNSPVRAFRGVGGTPVFVRRASGAWFEDVDGHRYIDYVGSWGPMILGHAHPAVIEAIGRAALDGTSFGCPTSLENDMAELLQELMPSLERVRMVSSGTEATLSAIRLARGFTGRTKLLKFAGNYHGHGDSLLVEAGSGVATLGIPGTPGILPDVAAHTLTVEYNDLEAVDAVFARHGDDIAAVIVEPVAGNMGLVPPRPGFLGRLRSRCDESGALLIFDEVMTGFRVALGGAQALFGVRPDLTTIGKIVGGGLPAAAYDTPGLHDDLARRTQRLAEGLAAEARSAGHPAVAQYVGAMFSVFFSSEPVWSYADARRSNASLFRGWFHAMLDRGVYLAPSAFEAAFVGAAHSDAIIDETLDIAKAAFASV